MTPPAPPEAPQTPARQPARLLRYLPLALFALLALAFFTVMQFEDRKALPSTLIAKPVPRFTLPGLGTEAGLSDADLRAGQISVVNIWASWCGPCRVEHPKLIELAETHRIPVYGINYKDNPEKAQSFLNKLGNPYAKVGVDEKGRAAIDWGVYGVPETFVINGLGEIVYKHVGPIQNDDLETKILPAIARARK